MGLRLRLRLQLLLLFRLGLDLGLDRRQRSGKGCRCWCSLALGCVLGTNGVSVLVHVGFSAVGVLSDGLDGFPLLLAEDDEVEAWGKTEIGPVTC
jgi:hypothetical protein